MSVLVVLFPRRRRHTRFSRDWSSDVCSSDLTVPLVIRTTTGGGKQLGATHSHAPEVIFAHFPGLYVAVPGTAYDAKGMLKAAIQIGRATCRARVWSARGGCRRVPAQHVRAPD